MSSKFINGVPHFKTKSGEWVSIYNRNRINVETKPEIIGPTGNLVTFENAGRLGASYRKQCYNCGNSELQYLKYDIVKRRTVCNVAACIEG